MNHSRQIIVIAHNLRSAHNVGSLLRTAEGLGIDKVVLSGYTPYPVAPDDNRLPHESRNTHQKIAKSALGAEETQAWEHITALPELITGLKSKGWQVYALEQDQRSLKLPDFQPADKVAIILGREVEGLEPEIMKLCDATLEIPMFGKKESYNVVQAAAMAMYHIRFQL